jgi:hypothetical protein
VTGDDSKLALSERVILWTHDTRGAHDADAGAARIRASGGQVLAVLGSTVVASFDPMDLTDAIDLARTLAQGPASVGIALGEISSPRDSSDPIRHRGAALDHAHVLALKAHGGEVVLDEASAAVAAEHFLFTRELSTAIVHGRALDADNPRKDACRQALERLRPAPVPQSALPALEALRQRIESPGHVRIALRSEAATAPLELIDGLASTLQPALRLRVSRTAGGLQPLGGLSVALRRLWPEDQDFEAAGLPPALRARVKALLRGQAVHRSEMVTGLCELLAHFAARGTRPWVVLDQLQDIDPATLGVIAETALTPGMDFALFMTMPSEVLVPAALTAKAELHEISLPALDIADRRIIAETVLALEESSEVALRVALLGGETALGVQEAARTLVSAGDLVARGETFAWRTVPRSGIAAVPVEALITERALGLAPDAYRALEALCVTPVDAPRDVFRAVAERDGLSHAALDAGVQQLLGEGFVDAHGSLGNGDALIRGALRNNMPPARAAELHRFVADVLSGRLRAKGFGSGQLAYHLAEGGLESEAALALVDAAQQAVEASFHRVALRLLATAVELDGSAEVRRLAGAIAAEADAAGGGNVERRSSRPPPPQTTDQAPALPIHDATTLMAHDAIRAAREALLAGDFDSVERWLDTAVAAGWPQRAAQRVLAMSLLARGRTQDATTTLSRVRGGDAQASASAQDALCWALIHLEGGEPHRAIRDALAALTLCRHDADERGERATLQVLAWCYESVARPEEAGRITTYAAQHAS